MTTDLDAFTRDIMSLGWLTDDGRAVYGRSVQESVGYAVFGVGLQRIVGRSGWAPLQRTPRRLSPGQCRTVSLQSHENPSGPVASRVRGPVHDGGPMMHYLKNVGFSVLDLPEKFDSAAVDFFLFITRYWIIMRTSLIKKKKLIFKNFYSRDFLSF